VSVQENGAGGPYDDTGMISSTGPLLAKFPYSHSREENNISEVYNHPSTIQCVSRGINQPTSYENISKMMKKCPLKSGVSLHPIL